MSAEKPTPSTWLALFSLCLAAFIAPLAMSAVNLALPPIALELNADAVQLSWLASLPVWGSVILMLPIARAADIWGRKRIHLLGLALFSLSSLAAAGAETINQLLSLRVMQGISSSFIFATAMAIVAGLAGSKRRGMFLGLVSTCVYIGLTFGPVAGGWLTHWLGWRSVFWLPVAVVCCAFILIYLYVPETTKSTEDKTLHWYQRLDVPGSILFAACSSACFFGLAGLPQWPYALLLLLGIFLGWAFFRQQRSAVLPLVRIDLIKKNRVFVRSLAASFCMYSASFPILFLMSIYLQYIEQMSPTQAGHVILLQALFMALVAPFAGRLSDKYEPRIIASCGAFLFVLGALILASINAQTPITQIQLGLILLGIGFGLFSSPNNNAAMSAIDPSRLGIAAALLNLGRTGGNMFSTAAVVVLFNFYIGYQTIEPAQFPLLFTVIRISIILCAIYAVIGVYFSLTRGKIR